MVHKILYVSSVYLTVCIYIPRSTFNSIIKIQLIQVYNNQSLSHIPLEEIQVGNTRKEDVQHHFPLILPLNKQV